MPNRDTNKVTGEQTQNPWLWNCVVLGLALITTFSPEWGGGKRPVSAMSSLDPNSSTSTKLRGTLHFRRNFWSSVTLPLPLPLPSWNLKKKRAMKTLWYETPRFSHRYVTLWVVVSLTGCWAWHTWARRWAGTGVAPWFWWFPHARCRPFPPCRLSGSSSGCRYLEADDRDDMLH